MRKTVGSRRKGAATILQAVAVLVAEEPAAHMANLIVKNRLLNPKNQSVKL
jgi:hypothetical protein